MNVFSLLASGLLWSSLLLCADAGAERIPLAPSAAPVSAGLGTYFVIETDGTVMSWGESFSPFGPEEDTPYSQRYPVFDGGFSVWSGRFSTVVLDRDFTLWSPGGGTGAPEWEPLLAQVSEASLGLWHGAAVCRDGSVWTWGDNSEGQLGTGALEDNRRSLPPQKVLDGAAAVYTGDFSTFAVTKTGMLYGWGEGFGPTPELLFQNIRTVRGAGGCLQVLTRTGELFLYDSLRPEDGLMGPVAAQVAAVSEGAYQTEDGALFLWDIRRGAGPIQATAVPVEPSPGQGWASATNGMYHLLRYKDGTLALAEIEAGKGLVKPLP